MNGSITGLTLYQNKLTVIVDEIFKGFHKLLHLNLSRNLISDLSANSFNGLQQLVELDLTFNNIANLTGTPFHNLTSLKRLNLSNNWITSLTASSLSRLTNLEVLTIDIDRKDISDTPFIDLVSLKSLHVETTLEPDETTKIIYGLTKLETLNLAGFHINWTDFCSLNSLQTLKSAFAYYDEQNIPNECITAIPLKYVDTGAFDTYSPSPFKFLKHLRNLTSLVTSVYSDDLNAVIQELHSLSSPLQSLNVQFLMSVTLNSTTFESLAKWNASLTVLEIVAQEFWIEDSPFGWFPHIQILKMSCPQGLVQPLRKLSSKTFDGLTSLQQLHLNYLQFNVYESSALNILGRYNSLKVLNLANNGMDYLTYDQLCLIPSVEKLEFSYNHFDSLPSYYTPCTPNLTKLLLPSNGDIYRSILVVFVCQNIPKLATFNAKYWPVYFVNGTCLKLETLNLESSSIQTYAKNTEMYVPNLKRLYMAKVNLRNAPIRNIKETPTSVTGFVIYITSA